MWVPKTVHLELEDIMREDRLTDRNDAMYELVKYARVGRETQRMMTFDFSRKIRLPPVKKPKRKK